MRRGKSMLTLTLALSLVLAATAASAATRGYYRQPTIHGDTIVFAAEGDLWKVDADGGTARRLTSHPGEEAQPEISPDGTTIAFTGQYEGPTELYTMPIDGGRPQRRTWGADGVAVSGWTPDGRLLYATQSWSTLPSWQLVAVDLAAGERPAASRRLPLAQAADGAYSADGTTVWFTRLPFQGSHTKRYRGGTAQQIWRFSEGDAEALPLAVDFNGTSKRPMLVNGRIWFVSDRDGTMNLWSMDGNGGELRQHTHHDGWDVTDPSADGARIVYRVGADLWRFDVASGEERRIDVVLESDLDQTREHWIDEPMKWLTAAHPSPDGDRVALTARGLVFVAPVKGGRLAQVSREPGVRHRDARFMPDGTRVLSLSDRSGEVELWTLPADGVGEERRLTEDGDVLRWQAVPSPDGKRIAHTDKNQRLWVLDVDSGAERLVEANRVGDPGEPTWSPDSRWLAWVAYADNGFRQLKLHEAGTDRVVELTGDRWDSYSPAWSADGRWLYLLSDRNLVSVVSGPWGSYQPEPFLDRTTRIYQIALRAGERSPFAPPDELHRDEAAKDKDSAKGRGQDAKDTPAGKRGKAKAGDSSDGEAAKEPPPEVKIDLDGIQQRLQEVPLPPGDYRDLSAGESALFWLKQGVGEDKPDLVATEIERDEHEIETVVAGIDGYELTADRKKILLRRKDTLHVIAAEPSEANLEDTAVDLSHWALAVVPRDEWRQMFAEAWRLERDYFYDPGMHGVDWPAMRRKYEPLVERVTTRAELSDLLGQMVSELAALHIFVRGGDLRGGPDDVEPSLLGATLERDEEAGGYRVVHVWRADPDEPGRLSPLARPGVDVVDGDVIAEINGVPTLDVEDPGVLLRRQAGRQVRLRVRPAGGGEPRDAIVEPIGASAADDLRYHEWEYTRRLAVERQGEGRIGYVHLRAMGRRNYTEWAEGFYPVFTRDGLIVDVRHNRGGNIDSWILSRLMRKAWMRWSQRVGESPTWNMQDAFRGHLVVLCDEYTASDGEVFTEGFRRLGLGPVIGTRTWGGEIWLTSSNVLVDRGIATAAEFGVYGPEGEWLIEGRGVEPDIVVDNPPHATFEGHDAQLDKAIEVLKRKIAEEPVEAWPPPSYPDKSEGGTDETGKQR